MKRNLSILLASLLVAAVAFAPIALAGPVGTMELNLGYAKSSTELGSSTESLGGGVGFGASYWRGVSPTVSWGGEVSVDNLGSADYTGVDAFATAYTENFKTNIVRITPAVRVNFGSLVGPSFYAQGGAGLYKVSWKYRYEDVAQVVTADDSSTKFGMNLGAGVGFPVAPTTRMNFSASYHIVPGNDVNMTDTNNLQLRAGIGFNL